MKSWKIRLLAASISILSLTSVHAQTSVWTDGGGDSAWSNSANWSGGVPVSSSVVQIAVQPSGNTVGIDTGGPTTIGSLSFQSSLTGAVTVVPATVETLQVNGAVTNLSSSADTLSIPVIAGASATYGGGTGLNFSQLAVNTNSVATTGSVAVSQTLVLTINSSSTFGTIGSVNVNGATININGNYTGTLGDTFHLTSGSGFAGATLGTLPTLSAGLSWNTSAFDSTGVLTVAAPADQTLTGATPGTINIITGATTTVGGTLTNTAQTGANALAVGLADNGSTGGAITGLTAASGTTVAANTSTAVTGTLTAGGVGLGKTWSISNTDPSATTPTVSTSGTVNIYSHANGVLSVTGSTVVNAITGASVVSNLNLTNTGTSNVSLSVQSNGTGVAGLSGTVTANGSTTGTGTTTAGAAGTVTHTTYSTNYQEDQSVIGATTGTITTTSGTVTINNFNHAAGALAVTGSTTINAIAGTSVASSVVLTNTGSFNVSTSVQSSGPNLTLSGTVGANGSITGTGTTTAGVAGSVTHTNYTANLLEDQSVLGANTSQQAVTTGTVTINSFNHANGALGVTGSTTINAIAGTSVVSSVVLTNSGSFNVSTSVQSNGAGLTLSGTVGANGTITGTGTTVAGTAGTVTHTSYTTNLLEDQSVLGANTGLQTATTGSITINNFSHAAGAMSVTGSTTLKAIAGTVVVSNLSFINNGATNDALSIVSNGTGVSGLSGTLTANGVTTGTGTTTAGAAGTTTNATYSTTWTEDQSVLGSTAGNQTTTSGTVTIQNYSHASGVLSLTGSSTVNAIQGAAVVSTLSLKNNGATNDDLSVQSNGSGVSGLTGTVTANGTTTGTGTTTAGTAGTVTHATYSTNWLEDQSVLGSTTGTQTAISGTVTINNFSHAAGLLTVSGSTTFNAIAGTLVVSNLTFTNNGATNDKLSIISNSSGVSGLTGTLAANGTTTGTGTTTAGTAGTTTTSSYTTTWLEDQTVIGATAGNQTTSTGTITINNFSHAAGVLSITTPTTVNAITGATVVSGLSFLNNGATNDSLAIVSNGSGVTGLSGTLSANGTTTGTGTTTAGAAGTVTHATYSTTWLENQSVLGSTAGNQTTTSGTVTINNFGKSAPVLSTTTNNLGNIHTGTTVATQSVTLSDTAGASVASLQINSLGGLVDTGSGTITQGTGRALQASVGTLSTLGAYSQGYTITTSDASSYVGATANSPVTYTVTANVYSGQGVWNGGSGSWGTLGSGFGTNWGTNQGSPGLDSNFVSTDTATFGGTAGTVTLAGASASLKSITFNTASGNYNIAASGGALLKLNGGAGVATISDLNGSHTISAGVELDTNTLATVTNVADTLTLAGNLTGSGNLSTGGAGTVFLAGSAAALTGSITVSSGTLKLGSNNSLANASQVVVNGGTVDLNGHSDTFNEFSGTGGTVTTSTGSSTLTINESADPLYAGNITGAISIVQTGGAGLLQLSGANTYTGGTTIVSGTLQVGSATALGTGFVVNNGTLGTFGGQHVIQVGSTGPIPVVSNYTQGSTGALAIGINSAPGAGNTNDILQVTGAASLNGTLLLTFVPSGTYSPQKGDVYKIVAAAGGLSGTFTSTVLSEGALQLVPTYTEDGNNFYVNVSAITQLAFATLPGASYTPNQLAIAQYIDAHDQSLGTPGSVTAALVGALNNVSINPGSLPAAMSQLSPEKFASFTRSTIFNNASFSTASLDGYLAGLRSAQGDFMASNSTLDSSHLSVTDPTMDGSLASMKGRLLAWSPAPYSNGLLSDVSDPVLSGVDMKAVTPSATLDGGQPWNLFILGNAIWGQNSAQPGLSEYNSTTAGAQLGANFKITPNLRIGALFGYSHTDSNLDGLGSNAAVDSYAPGAYISYANHGWYANGIASYGFNNFTQSRHVSFGGLNEIAQSTPTGNQVVADADGGYDFHIKNWTVGPTIGLQYAHYTVDSYSETGAPDVDLNVNQQNSDSLRSRLGAHVGYLAQVGKMTLTPHLDASWQHEFLDNSQTLTSVFATPGVGSFAATTSNPSRESALLDAGLNADVSKQVTLFVDYLAQVGQSNYFGQSVQGGVKIGF